MNKQLLRNRNIAVVAIAAAVLGVASVTGVSLAVAASVEPGISAFSINDAGETYGPATSGQDPDLILAYGDQGELGYVRAADLNGPAFTMPADVDRWIFANPASEARAIPLYDKEGVRIIGKFTVSAAIVSDVSEAAENE